MIEELTKAAEAATPGPWYVVENPHTAFGGVQLYWIDSVAGNLAENICEEEATFIALANPDTILRLIAAIDHYEAALLAAFPSGASGATAEHWNDARKELK